MELNHRTRLILFSLIHCYIETGEPVASRTVVKNSAVNLSPASVRNILADLDEMGLVMQPHTSAGRVPTDLGYRFYVNSLMEKTDLSKNDESEISQMAIHYHGTSIRKELDTMLQETSRILSEVSHYIGLVMTPKLTDLTYNHMEFIRMQGRDVLVILVSQSGIVHSRMIRTDLDISQEELDELSRYLNQELCGMSLKEVRECILKEMEADMRLYRELLNKVFLNEDLEESHISKSQIYLEGTSNILDLPEFSDLDRMKRVFQAFEKKSILVELLDHSIHAEGVMVYIGSENTLRVLEDCSLVTANYKHKDKVVGTLGVIGPKRMDYSKVIPIVDGTAQLLSKFIVF